jgi:hypothetical protein
VSRCHLSSVFAFELSALRTRQRALDGHRAFSETVNNSTSAISDAKKPCAVSGDNLKDPNFTRLSVIPLRVLKLLSNREFSGRSEHSHVGTRYIFSRHSKSVARYKLVSAYCMRILRLRALPTLKPQEEQLEVPWRKKPVRRLPHLMNGYLSLQVSQRFAGFRRDLLSIPQLYAIVRTPQIARPTE